PGVDMSEESMPSTGSGPGLRRQILVRSQRVFAGFVGAGVMAWLACYVLICATGAEIKPSDDRVLFLVVVFALVNGITYAVPDVIAWLLDRLWRFALVTGWVASGLVATHTVFSEQRWPEAEVWRIYWPLI